MKNILLLTDFSNNALDATHYALQFFKSDKCTFYIMNVHKAGSFTSDDLMYSSNESIYDSITKEPREKLKKLVDSLKETYKNPNHNFETLIDFDVFTDAVNQAVKSKNIDYIVVGTNGITGAKEVVFGSNTLQIIRNVHCPTIIIPEEFKFKSSTNLLLSLDPHDSLNSAAFNQLQQFLKNHPHKLHILRINPHDEHSEEIQKDEEHLKHIKCTYNIINHVPLHYALNSYLQLNGIDKVTIFSKKESFFERFFTGSTSTKVSKNVHVPLLIFHS